jgi:hypothetical protein
MTPEPTSFFEKAKLEDEVLKGINTATLIVPG